MNTSNQSLPQELPSTKQLLISTFIALVTAALLLVTGVMPAEYGIDPTGLGTKLGLTEMGEIKMQLAEEAAQDALLDEQTNQATEAKDTQAAVISTATTPSPTTNIDSQATSAEITSNTSTPVEPVIKEESRIVTLKPGEAAEIKLAMNKAETANFNWSVDKGHLNYDIHGDTKGIKYHNYSKGKAVTQDKGQMTAAFDGKHGWFWRNRSKETVTLTLIVSGQYSEIIRVL